LANRDAVVTVSTGESQQVYEDSFYACDRPGVYVDFRTASTLAAALDQLAKPAT
jgi:hypothetical protein